MAQIYIGTSGWSYDSWLGPFYPDGTASKDFLTEYARHFATVEINNSFYHLPKPPAVKAWNKETPKDFLFAIKASRYTTHNKKLKDPKDSTQKFFTAIKPLGHKIGPILFQLPPHWKCNPQRLDDFLTALSRRRYRYAFEFRHESWFHDEVYDILRKANAALCLYHLAGFKSPEEMTADFTYVRLHGPGKAYQGSYNARTLSSYADKFKDWKKNGCDVYCYFDNDQKGYAPKDAMRLAEKTGIKKAG